MMNDEDEKRAKMKHIEMIIDYLVDGDDFQYSDNHGILIRCKDCKHHHRDNSGAYYCERKDYGYGWGLNDFCSKAERREKDVR